MKKYRVKGVEYEFLSVSELAEVCGRKAVTIRKLTERGILPEPNLRDSAILITKGDRAGEKYDGKKLYSKQLAKELADYFRANVRQGSKITQEMRMDFIKIFNKERKMLEGK